jgi:tetratricopeptide (TPR) repeat protein
MSESTIRTALGVLQDEPDNERAWQDLGADVRKAGADALNLLGAARAAHEMRREYEAVSRLLELEVEVATGDRQIELIRELARLRDDILLEDAAALASYRQLLELRPDDADAKDGIERSEVKRSKWKDLAQKYFVEAKSANDPSFKSSLLVSAAEIAYRYARPELEAREAKKKEEEEAVPKSQRGKGKKKKKGGNGPESAQSVVVQEPNEKSPRHALFEKIIGLLRDALVLDPRNRRAMILLERVLQSEQRWDELAKALDTFATEQNAKDEKLASLTRLARVQMKKLRDTNHAITTYERILDFSPNHPEATRVLVDRFTQTEQWDHLVSLYEGQLQAAGGRADPGTLLQVAMVNWRMRNKPDAAEPYFERFRKTEPAHPGMLGFFREYLQLKGDQTRLVGVLSDAQRAMPDGPERAAVAGEIAQLAEVGENASKAIEQWRALLRAQPDNYEAREALKRLYRATSAWNHLADLLRGELERIAPDSAARLPTLREIAQIYRESIKSDAALVTVLSQIIALDENDADAVRELARVYEALGRWRDLLTTQMRLAELERDDTMKAELYRSIAKRWLEQFSNVQNAIEAFEKLRQAKPDDQETFDQLRELYGKRRAYKPLYDLLESDTRNKSGAERRALWAEMARLASDRLDKGSDASRLYRLILDEEPTDAAALDALEKQAERDKDFATVTSVLERRIANNEDNAAKISGLQRLAQIYAERLDNQPEALRAWRRILDLAPGHPKALRTLREAYIASNDIDALADLYAVMKDWNGLAEVLSNGADRTDDVEKKVQLSYRVANLFENELRQPERAFRAYERILSVKPDDERAATALMPIYEREEKWARLPALYEVLLNYAHADQDKRFLYGKLTYVIGDRLSDKVAAMRWARKTYELVPQDPHALQALENLARVSGEWNVLTEAIHDRVNSSGSSPEEKRSLRLKLAEISAHHAGAPDDAVTAYRDLIETNPNDADAVAALDRLLRSQPDRKDDLRWLFKLRIDRAGAVSEAVSLLAEWANLEEDVFGEPNRAIAVYKDLLKQSPKHAPALRGLVRIYMQQGDAESAAQALEREKELEEGATKIARELELARLYMGPLKNPLAALDCCKRALEMAPIDPKTISLVEELLPVGETRKEAATLLEHAYQSAGQFDKQGEVLTVLLATATAKADRLPLHLRLAAVKQNLGDRHGAFNVLSAAALEHPAELDLWDRLTQIATKSGKIAQFVETLAQAVPERGETGLPINIEMELADRAAIIYDESLGDIDKARPYLDRILSRDPTNDRAFLRLKQILTTRELWSDLEALYERVIAASESSERKTELLAEVGIIAEEITQDIAKAVNYYERILQLEPDHDQAVLALDTLYAAQERWQDLADLLRKRIERATSGEPTALRLRLATLLHGRLSDPKGALDELQLVCEAEPANREARDLVEKCLGHADLRQRAAAILETVYADRDEIRDLVRILEVRLEALTEEQPLRELLQRVAELKDERLTDDPGAFATYSRLLPLAPAEVTLRERYLEISGRLSKQSEAADVLAEAAKRAEAPQPRAEILNEVAKIHETAGRMDRSEAVHRQILDLAPDDPAIALPPARSLEKIYIVSNRAADLVGVLRVQVKLESDTPVRRDLLARIGQIAEDTLKDDAGAIVAWKERLDEDPTDEEALGALDRLYERGDDKRALVEILRKREENASNGDTKRGFMERAAKAYVALANTDDAIAQYRAILDEFGADRPTLIALASLYEKAERWRDLESTFEADLGIAHESADRISLLTRMGDVRRKKLGEVAGSIEAYRQALTIDPDAVDARTALEELLGDENARAEAAEILRPLYESTGDSAKLLRVLDIQIEQAHELDLRLDLLARVASTAEDALNDGGRAFTYTSRGLRESAAEPSLDDWIKRAERLTEKSGLYHELVDLYRSVAPDVLDEDKQVSVLSRIAELARTKLNDNELAKTSYRRALELRPENSAVLTALEELYSDAKEWENLVDVLKRRAEIAESDADKRHVLYKLARVCDESIADRERAIASYEQVLDLGLDAPAIEALERLYASAGRWNDLVALHERELHHETTPPERKATINHGLGHIFNEQLHESDRAFDAYGEALNIDAQHPATIGALEKIVADGAGKGENERVIAARAAALLEPVYLARLDWRKVIGAVEARLAGSTDPSEKRDLLRRLAKLHEEQEEQYTVALDIMALLLAEDPNDETTWSELERLARVANGAERLAQIYAGELAKIADLDSTSARLAYRTGELFEQNGDTERALNFYRRAYDYARADEQRSFVAIDRILLAGERAADRIALYRDSLEYRHDPVERLQTLHALAKIQEDSGDPEASIETLRTALDVDETDVHTLDSLDVLYTRRERWKDLADLQRRRAEHSAMAEEESKWRLSLAKILDVKLSDALGAIDELEAVTHLAPPQTSELGKQAVVALEAMLSRADYRPRIVELLKPIYEAADDWKKLVEIGRYRFDIAGSPGERVAVLRENAMLLEERGANLNKAFENLAEAFVLDPDDGDTREELDRLAVATSRWDDLARTYESGIAKIDGVGKKELLEALAKLHDKRRDDPRRALDAWERLFALDETDPRPLDEMDALATLLSDWSSLVRVLAKRAELTTDDEERASLWRRIGEARRDMLDDQQGAIDAYERALELEPDSAWTLDNLIALYEDRNDAARLVDLYRRRIELCGEPSAGEYVDEELKHRLLLDAARCYEIGLQDRREAVVLLGQALTMKPNDPDITKRLMDLYEGEKMWPELLESLRGEVERSKDPDSTWKLTKRIGRLLAKEMEDFPGALDAFRQVLAHGYDEETAAEVRRIGEAREELRRDAAEVLIPVLTTANKAAELADAYELRLRAETDPADRATSLRTIAKVAETQLSDPSRAQNALLRALTEQPADGELHDEISRIATLLGKEGWERYANVLSERATSIFEPATTAELFLRLGRIAENKLNDLPRAAEAYAKSAEQGGDSHEVLKSLERVYAQLGDTRALSDVLERRVGIETEPSVQADLHHRLAALQIDALGDKAQGLATLRIALERVPGHEAARAAVERLLIDGALFDDAFDTLEGVYRSTNKGEELARLYERRIDRADGPRGRTRARLDLARIRENEANDANGAQRAVEAAIIGEPTDPDVLIELERLANKNNAWKEAAAALARALEVQESIAPKSPGSAELWARLGAWSRDKVQDNEGAERAFVKALEAEGENIEWVRAVEALRRGPGRERERVASLRRLAKLEGEPSTQESLAKEAATIAEMTLADPKLTEEIVRELLEHHDANPWALEELTRLREQAGDFEEVVELLVKRAEAAADGTAALALRHRAADVAETKLSDRNRAVAFYEEIFEAERTDTRAQERLRALYGELGKYTELAKLLGVLIEQAESPAARSALRIELARLSLDKFEAPAEATDTLRAVLDEEPDHEKAAELLLEIFDRGDRAAELAELRTQLVERARARGDVALELHRMVELGAVLELRLKDIKRALETYDEILTRDPKHKEALESVARLSETRGAWDKAATALVSLLDIEGNSVALALRLAAARKELGDDAGVEEALKRALEAEPKNTDVRERLAQLYERTKKWLELANLLASDADLVAEQHGNGGEPSAAPKVMSLAPGASMPPAAPHVGEQVRLLRRAAEIHMKERGQPADAIPMLERATSLVPMDRNLLLVLCDVYAQAKRDREAANVLERIIASFGTKRTKELSVYHHRLGRALAALGDQTAALGQYDMAFKIDPGSIEVLRDLGILAIETNDLDRALKTFRALLLQRLDANSAISKGEVFYYLGEISMKQGDKAKAVQMLERAVENDPQLTRAKTMLSELKG